MIETRRERKPSAAAPNEEGGSYKCPGCGECVSNDDADAMRQHHVHVLNPPMIDQSAETLKARLDFDRLQSELHARNQSSYGRPPRLLKLRH